MSHGQITILYLLWQRQLKICKWEQLNFEFSCNKIQDKRWWKTEVLLAETQRSNQAKCLLLPADVGYDTKFFCQLKAEEEEIFPFSPCGQGSSKIVDACCFLKETAVSDLVSCVSECATVSLWETIHTHTYTSNTVRNSIMSCKKHVFR